MIAPAHTRVTRTMSSQRRRYEVAIAILCGTGLPSLLLLLLRIAPVALVSVALALPLVPGFVLAGLLWRSEATSPPLAVVALNAMVYSTIALGIVSAVCRDVGTAALRLVTIRLLVPAFVLTGLTCIPALNPLWPRGMTELAKQEVELQAALPLNMDLAHARDVLRSRGVLHEETATTERTIWSRQDASVTAAPDDRVVWSRLETAASQFPCGYQIEVFLIFGPDEKLKRRHIQRAPVCP